MQPAVGVVGALRDLIVVRGTVTGAASAFAGGAKQISIVGQATAVVAGGGSPAIHLATGDAYVRAIKLGPSASIGCQADSGSTLRLDHVVVTGNSAGGILLDGAAFDIENTTVTSNGPGDLTGLPWGGIRVQNIPVDGPKILKLVTVQTNNPIGVSCSAAVSGPSGVLAIANLSTDISPTCAFLSCGAASSTCGAQ